MSHRKIFTPTSGPDGWKNLLADPEKQWRTGYSARTLAYAWEAAQGNFPPEVQAIFNHSRDERLNHLELLLAFPEWKVDLPPGGHASQNDLFVLAKSPGGGLAAIMVEGKVSESFGPRLDKWLNPPSTGKRQRLEFIKVQLGLQSDLPGSIRYQLLHRTVSAVIEAQRFGADCAVMLVHSFNLEARWLEDYQDFLALYGIESAQPGQLYLLRDLEEVALFSGWVTGDPQFLRC